MIQTTLADRTTDFFDEIISAVQTGLSLDALPSVVTGADGMIADVVSDLQATRDAILAVLADPGLGTAIDALDPTDDLGRAQLLRDALATLGTVVVAPPDGTDVVSFTLTDSVAANLVDVSASADLGVSGIGLDVSASADLDVSAAYAFGFTFDVSDADLDFDGAANDEFVLALSGDLDFMADASLGVLGVSLSTTDPDPELNLQFALNLGDGIVGSGGGVVASATVSGGLGTTLTLETEAGGLGLLPTIGTDIALGLTLEETDILGGGSANITPSLEFTDVRVRSDALAALFDGFLGEFAAIADVFPLRQLRELLARDLPILKDVSPLKTVRDLVEAWAQGNQAFELILTVIDVLDIIDALQSLGSDTGISLGSIGLDSTALNGVIGGGLGDFGTLFDSPILPGANPLDEFSQIESLPGLSLPFLTQGPQLLVQILLNEIDLTPVTLIEYDVPGLAYEASAEIKFPIFGPLVGILGGGFNGFVDINVGYSTRGLFGPDPSFLDGFFISTDPLGGGEFAPIAGLTATVEAGLALDAFIAQASVTGGIMGNLGIQLAGQDSQGRAHLSDIPFPCLFDELNGGLDAFLKASLRVGIGPLGFEISKVLASIQLLQFSLDLCNANHDHGAPEIDDAGLATLMNAGTGTWRLNVGANNTQRNLPADVDQDANGTPATSEVFRIRQPAPATDGTARPGVAIEAFGIVEIIGETEAVNVITAEAGSFNDAIIVEEDVGAAFSLSGGDGEDILVAGALGDTLYGDADFDSIVAGAGNDTLYGGTGNDFLEGGQGADGIYGGDGQDQVSYENSLQGVIFTPIGGGAFQGTGGDAQGDIVEDVEVIIGSREDDQFFGNPNGANIVQSGDGNDSITGGALDDFLIGGAGGDEIDGLGGVNQTSYILSNAGVNVNLFTGTASGGHATGDMLSNIQIVQGSFYNDVLVSSGQDGQLAGSNGDDILRSTGGAVDLFAGLGDDEVQADGDAQGGMLNGGGFLNVLPGRDLLTFRFAPGPITVDLEAGTAGADTVAFYEIVDAPPGQPGTVIGTATGYSTFADLEGTDENDTLTGDRAGNSISGRGGDDMIYGGQGDDSLTGGLGADAIYGGQGSDWAIYSDSFSAVQVSLALGTASGGTAAGDNGFGGVENLLGSSFNDTLDGDANPNRIDPGRAFGGQDDVDGNGGDDTLQLRYGALSAGITLSHIVSFGSVTGATALTYSSIESIDLDGTAFADVVDSQAFTNDIYHLRGGDDSISEGGGLDIIRTGAGDDRISHGGAAGASNALGLLDIDGGSGIDRLSVDLEGAVDPVVFVMGAPTVENPNQAFSLENLVAIRNIEIIEDVETGAGNDTLVQPGFVNNVFSTGLGDDIIAPGLGFDTIDGGDPSAFGTTDVDTLIVDYRLANAQSVTTSVQFDSQGNSGTITGLNPTVDRIVYQDIERIFMFGTNGDDLLIGATDIWYTGPGNILNGAAGNDTIQGFEQADLLGGGLGGDVIYGGGGNDTLIAGVNGGDDLIDDVYGGAGADLFVLGDETGYFYGEASINPPDNRDGIFIRDFDPTQGDQIQLVGDPGDYTTADFLGSTALLRGISGQPFIDAILFGFTGFDLSGSYVTYVQEAAANPGEDAPSVQETTAELADLLGLTDAEIAGLLDQAAPDGADIAAQIRSGALDGFEVFDAFNAAASALQASAPQDPAEAAGMLNVAHTGAEANTLAQIILCQLQTIPGDLSTDINITTNSFGDPTAFAEFTNGFGMDGLVISTGVAEEQAGPNLADGAAINTFGAETLVPLVDVGRVGATNILRADVTGLDITSVLLTDAFLLNGASGTGTGSDIDTIFFSTTEFSGNSTAFDSLAKLDVLDFSPLGVDLDLGPQRGGAAPGSNLAGTLNGLLNNAEATLDQRDHVNNVLSEILSLGDGGTAEFFLDQPLIGTETPTYLYVGEAGAVEGLYLTVKNDPALQQAGPTNDLSTDFGVFGPEGDLTGFDVTVDISIDGMSGQVVELDLFNIVITMESYLEYAGADVQDMFRVTVNGADALTLRDGSAASLDTLALSPTGVFHPDLVLNPVGTGPMADQLRADAYTEVLTVRAPIVIGQTNTIRLEVEDGADGLLDLAMYIAKPGSASLDDAIAVFNDPADADPVGVFDDLQFALNSASNGDFVQVGTGAATELGDVGPAMVGREDLLLDAPGPFGADLMLDDGITAFSAMGGGGLGLTGNGAANTITAGSGNDTIDGGPGGDSLNGARGTDTLSYAGSTEGVMIDLGTGTGTGGDAEGDTVAGFENLVGSGQADMLVGDGTANTITGGDGNDVMRGGLGPDDLIGGEGFNFADYRDATGALVIDLATPSNSSAFFAEDTLTDVRGLFGANAFRNAFNGDEARSFFTGGAQDDEILGNDGGDILRGRGGNDIIDGGEGRDAILGNAGNDTLTGGGDRDIFWFGIVDDNDVITDFMIGSDLIGFQGTAVNQLSDLTFNTSTNGWALLEWNGGTDSVELENVTATQMNAASNFFFI